MDFCSQPGLLPLKQALKLMLEHQKPLEDTETLALAQALDRVLAGDIYSRINVPGTDNSAMDGYAVRAQDCPGKLRVIGESFAGHAFTGQINPGDAVRIMTGASIPNGADTVVMQEDVTLDGQTILLNKIPIQGDNIRRAGEDTHIGQILLHAGQALNPLHIGFLASAGISQVKVTRLIRVAILCTGDELVTRTEDYQPGKIFDSNRPMLAALLQRMPVEIMDLGVIPDNPDALRSSFHKAMAWADVIISTGGVSVGDADYTKDILAELGQIDFWKVAIKPGKPFAYGHLGKSLFFGLPGNPVSAAVTYHQLVVPVLRRLAGEQISPPLVIKATAAQPLKKSPGRMDFQRGQLCVMQGENRVMSAGTQSSGVLRSLANANCFIRLEQERGAVNEGESVDVVVMDRFIL